MHNHFIELRGQLVLGRDAEVSTIMEYVQNGTLSDGADTEGVLPLMVLGPAGSGKSALMSHCTLQMKKVCTVAQNGHTCKLKMLLQTKNFTCKLKMLLQIKNCTCKLKILQT